MITRAAEERIPAALFLREARFAFEFANLC